jgi:hypothetical protein
MFVRGTLFTAFAAALVAAAAAGAADDGFVPLFDGKDLSAWVVPEGDNGHWKVAGGIIEYDGKSESKKDKNLWSAKEYGDFTVKFEWRFPPPYKKRAQPVVLPDGSHKKGPDGKDLRVEIEDPDSGIYLRGSSKSQVNLWNWNCGSGEVYGYRMDQKMSAEVRAGVTPKKRMDKPLGDWNAMVITMKGDRLTVSLNGEEVITNAQLPGVPATGRLALQHHNDPIQFRNIWVKELK